jgi:hypothetical protein
LNEILQNSKIEKIDLGINNITARGLEYLKESLKNNTYLIEIDLRGKIINNQIKETV